jgi:hypothetical protein
VPRKYTIQEEDIDEKDEEAEENSTEETSETDNNGSNRTQDRQKRKAELESELQGLEQQIKDDADAAAEEIAEEEPAKSEVKAIAKDEAAVIADGYKLTKEEEDRLTSAIATKVVQQLRDGAKTNNPKPPRAPDRRPKPTHFSERTILSRKRSRE